MKTLGLVIVTWNSKHYLRKCLNHVRSQTVKPDKVVVVDNKSQDNCLDCIKDFPEAEVVAMQKNIGFAAANNFAINHCLNTYWAVLLNPDAFPEPGWLENLVQASMDYPDYDVFASRMLKDKDSSFLDGAGDCYHISGLAWRRGHGRKAAGRYEKSDDIFSPCGASAMYRRQAFIASGGFDEDMFCYFEDVDLGFRMNLAGYKSRYAAKAVVRHVGSGSKGKYSDFELYHGNRNLIWCWVANMPGVLFWIFLPFHVLQNIILICYMTVKGHGPVVLKAKIDAVRSINKSLAKRRRKKIGNPDLKGLLNLMSFDLIQR